MNKEALKKQRSKLIAQSAKGLNLKGKRLTLKGLIRAMQMISTLTSKIEDE